MTVFIADISECDIFDGEWLIPLYESGLPRKMTDRIYAKKSPEARRESAVAYLLLFEALKEIVSEKNVREELITGLYFTKKGRPTFKNCDYDLSISHSDGICVVAVADNGMRIGADVEWVSERNVKTAESVLSRLPKIKITDFCAENIRALRFTKEGALESKVVVGKSDSYGERIISGWTALESALKCHGGGFSALKEGAELFRRINQASFTVIKNEKVFVVTLTEKKCGLF